LTPPEALPLDSAKGIAQACVPSGDFAEGENAKRCWIFVPLDTRFAMEGDRFFGGGRAWGGEDKACTGEVRAFFVRNFVAEERMLFLQKCAIIL